MMDRRETGEPRSVASLEKTVRMLGREISGFLSTGNWIWSDQAESALFLATVDHLLETIRNWHRISGQNPTVDSCLERANDLLEQAMFRLQDEFRYVIERNDASGNFSDVSGENGADDDDPDTNIPVANPVSDYDVLIDAFPSRTISELQDIAKRMIFARFEEECYHVYGRNRRKFIEVSLSRLGVHKLSDGEIQQMQREEIENEIKRWINAFKVSISILFPSERYLCDRIFFHLPYHADQAFMQVCRPSAMQLLNFADSVAITKRAPELLFKVLDIFEVMNDLMPAIGEIFSDMFCSFLHGEALTILKRLGQTVRRMFLELENLIMSDPTSCCDPNGGVHHITRYVMNYLNLAISDYFPTLEKILAENAFSPPNALNGSGSPLVVQIASILKVLEINLEEKSLVYQDPAQTSIFLMNNRCYILRKARGTQLGFHLGEEWLKRQKVKINQYLASYQTNSWSIVLSALKAESGAIATEKMAKEKLIEITKMFDELFDTQSKWVVPDEKIKSDLRLTIAQKIVPAYRDFLGRIPNVLEKGKHVKYSVEALGDRMVDLFSSGGQSVPSVAGGKSTKSRFA